MTKDEVADIVMNIIVNKFDVNEDTVIERCSLWDDFDADDLDFIEIFMLLEEKFAHGNFDCLNFEDYRKLTVEELIEHINTVVNPI